MIQWCLANLLHPAAIAPVSFLNISTDLAISLCPSAVSPGFNPGQSLDYLGMCADSHVWDIPAHSKNIYLPHLLICFQGSSILWHVPGLHSIPSE